MLVIDFYFYLLNTKINKNIKYFIGTFGYALSIERVDGYPIMARIVFWKKIRLSLIILQIT